MACKQTPVGDYIRPKAPLSGLWLDAYPYFDRMNGFIFGFVVAGAVRQLHEGLLAERRGKKLQFFE